MEKSDTDPMQSAHASPRCHARSKRTGQPCRSPAVRGWTVCRMHGARGGGQKGEQNGAYVHGERTQGADANRVAALTLTGYNLVVAYHNRGHASSELGDYHWSAPSLFDAVANTTTAFSTKLARKAVPMPTILARIDGIPKARAASVVTPTLIAKPALAAVRNSG